MQLAHSASSLVQRVKSAIAAPFSRLPQSGYGGQNGRWGQLRSMWNVLRNLTNGDTFNYEERAGDLWKSSVVGIALNFLQRNFPEAPLIVQKLKKGRWEDTFDHEILQLLSNPNEFWDDGQLWDATLLSWIVDGNAYWVKIRSDAGKCVELWWVPWWMMEPRWDEQGSVFITHYEYIVNGKSWIIDPSDVIHFRNGVNPDNTRKGMTDLNASKREIAGDNITSTYHASVMVNMGIPGVIFTPKGDGKFDPPSEGEAAAFKRDFKEKFTGKRAGEPLMLFQQWDVHTPGFSPDNLAIEKLLRVYESRIAAALGIPAVILGLLVGLETSTAKSSYKESLMQAYTACIKPLHRKLDSQLARQLMREFDNPKRARLGRDYSGISVLQEDLNGLYKRLVEACGGPFLTPNDARREARYEPIVDEDADKLRKGSIKKKPDGSQSDAGTAPVDENKPAGDAAASNE